jgi:hypothetical protein
MTGIIDDNWIETRFVWGRCSAKDAREIRSLIKAFQNDAWPASHATPDRKRESKRGNHR